MKLFSKFDAVKFSEENLIFVKKRFSITTRIIDL